MSVLSVEAPRRQRDLYKQGQPKVSLLQLPFPGVERCEIEEWPDMLYLRKLVVFPLFQSQGLGSKVLRHLKSWGKTIVLMSFPDDINRYEDCRRFYLRNGFVEQDGSDLMIWTP